VGKHGSDDVARFAAAVESRLTHPAAQAIVAYSVSKGLVIPERAETSHSMGMGVEADVEGQHVLCGSRRLMETAAINLASAEQFEKEAGLRGDSLAYVAINAKLAGLIAYSDTLRTEAAEMIRKLHRRGVKKIIMATGDNEASARRIAGQVGLDEVFSGAFPEQKADLVKKLQAEGFVVAVVGDGINDSPALAHATWWH
jgi:P-type E1-E2 ATPase